MQIIKKLDGNNTLAIVSTNDVKILEMVQSRKVQSNVKLALTKLSEANAYLSNAIASSLDFWNKAYPSKQLTARFSMIDIPAKKKRGKK